MKITHEDFKRSDRFLLGTAKDSTWNGDILFRWFEGGNALAYRHQDTHGAEFRKVDTKSGQVSPLFDHAAMAKLLSSALGKTVDAKHLPIDAFAEIEGEVFTVASGGKAVVCDLAKGEATLPELPSPSDIPPNTAPEGGHEVRLHDYNLWIKSPGGEEKAITTDGVEHHAYAGGPGSSSMAVAAVRRGLNFPPMIMWSPDGKRFIYYRLDERHVLPLHLIQAVPDDGSYRPKLHTYHYDMPGDETSIAEHFIYDVETGKSTPVQWPAMGVSIASPLQYSRVAWSGDGKKVFLIDADVRGRHLRLLEAEGATGAGRVVIDEAVAGSILPTWSWQMAPAVRRDLKNGDLIWYSERSDWGHFYLYDGQTGALKHAITSGEWLARDILYIDEEGGYLYFTASGREPGDHVFSVKAYRARLDGGGVELLTPEPGMHVFTALATALYVDAPSLSFAPNGAGFVDRMGGVDVLATWVLRAPDGRILAELAREDASPLPPFTMPEFFTVKSSDGKWDLHGVLLKPANFDPKKSYPVVEHIYPGPQTQRMPSSFTGATRGSAIFGPAMFGDGQAYADLGFIVMLFDGRGNMGRSKTFRDLSYGAMNTGSHLDDHVEALRQLAKDRPYIDLNRVGIFGTSGGGFATGHAMLARPDHYKVGVASGGNHENRINLSRFPETYHGLLGEQDYDKIFSGNLAHQLQGKLMLAHGELDDNVHPAATMRMADALIKAGKSFDMFIMPNVHHDIAWNPYFRRYQEIYFLKHLMGAELPEGPDLVPAGGYAKKDEAAK